jgi:hypothetical protein
VLAAGALVLVATVPGWCDEPRAELELVIASGDGTWKLGEALAIDVALQNAARAPVVLYHPQSIHMVSQCWQLSCRVTRPGGRDIVVEPEITFASAPLERREDFRELAPGDSLAVRISIQADDPMATHTPSGWVGLIPISEAESELLSEVSIKALYGIHGEVFFISGGRHWLAVRDLLADVFNQPGEYLLKFTYTNECTQAVEFREDGTGLLEPVDQAWSGRLTETLVIAIEE